MKWSSRREFLGSVGQGMLITSVGSALAGELDAAALLRTDRPLGLPGDRLPADLEALIEMMRTIAAHDLQPKLVQEWRGGVKLETLVAAAALANARSFGGTDYEGFHAFMALMPSYEMAMRMPAELRPLPVLKVIYRSTARIGRTGTGKKSLNPIEAAHSEGLPTPEQLRTKYRDRNMSAAEADVARLCAEAPARGYNALQWLVQDEIDVHQVVLPWRAWDMLRLTGEAHAQTLLRQCVRHCVDREASRVRRGRPEPEIRKVLPKVLDDNKLLSKRLGDKKPDDAWIEKLALVVFGPSREKAAHAVGEALAEGFDPEAVGEAISLAANKLLLHTRPNAKKRNGVHGASTGVHASDAANAWRHIARVTNNRNRIASLVVAGYHTAGQTDWVAKEPVPYEARSERIDTKDPKKLLDQIDGAIRNRDQILACAAVHKYGSLGLEPKPVFDLMLKYAVSEDGALHAEKYFQTAFEEFHSMRPAFRWRQLVTLARVTASEYGETAPGYEAARKLLKG